MAWSSALIRATCLLMKLRRYGNTDLMVSELCFGTMRYASKSGAEDATSDAGRRALDEAIDRGVNFIHSSYEYGTRWLTGKVLEHHPKRGELHHIIKVNVPDWGAPAFNGAEFRRQIEDALRELHAERIAVVQHLQRGRVPRELVYGPEGEAQRLAEFEAVIEPLREAFEELRAEGKVGHLATFPYTVGYARKAVESGAFSGVVAYYNILETEMRDLFDDMAARGMGFIGIRGLMAGLLTDARVNRAATPPADRFRDPAWDRAYDQLAELRSGLSGSIASWTDLALRFSVADERIVSTVVGINQPEQLRGVLAALAVADGMANEIIPHAHRICTAFRERYPIKGNSSGVLIY